MRWAETPGSESSFPLFNVIEEQVLALAALKTSDEVI